MLIGFFGSGPVTSLAIAGVAFGLSQGRGLLRALEQFRRTDRRAGLAPVGRVGRNNGQLREAKVRHGPRRGPDIERIPRRDEHDMEAIVLGCGRQTTSVEPRPSAGTESPAEGPALPRIGYSKWVFDHSHRARSRARSGVGAGRSPCGFTIWLSASRLQKARYSS